MRETLQHFVILVVLFMSLTQMPLQTEYVFQMASSGKICIATTFRADELDPLRTVHVVNYSRCLVVKFLAGYAYAWSGNGGDCPGFRPGVVVTSALLA